MFRFLLQLALFNEVVSAPVVGRKLLSKDPDASAIGIIVLVSLLFGPFILFAIIGLFRSKNLCYTATCCDKVCPNKVINYIGCCDDLCNDDCVEAGGGNDCVSYCCNCMCWMGCRFCDLFGCPHENKQKQTYTYNPRAYVYEDPKITKLRKDMNDYSKEKRLKEKTKVVTEQPPVVEPNTTTNKDDVTLFVTGNNEIKIID